MIQFDVRILFIHGLKLNHHLVFLGFSSLVRSCDDAHALGSGALFQMGVHFFFVGFPAQMVFEDFQVKMSSISEWVPTLALG